MDFFISYSPADERWASWIAWQLETAHYRTMLQAWDFVPGTNFLDFMDRGVRESAAVIAVLSDSYLKSTYGRWEWLAALRADPQNLGARLVPIRVENCPLEGLLATITWVDLVGVDDPATARRTLLDRVAVAQEGRAKPSRQPPYPHAIDGVASAGDGQASGLDYPEAPAERRERSRRAPVDPPPFPRQRRPRPTDRSQVTVLHLAGCRFGRPAVGSGAPITAAELQARVWGDLSRQIDEGAPDPDLIVVSGDLTESGAPRQVEEALTFLTGLRVVLGLEPHRLIVVPGPHDVTREACRAYFSNCAADDVEPRPPYWPKWRHFRRLFNDLYHGLSGPAFESEQPWTLFDVPDLGVAVAGVNSTIATTHRPEDQYGFVSEAQSAWFAHQLRHFEDQGWLRLGVVAHSPVGRQTNARSSASVGRLRDADDFDRLLGRRLNVLFSGVQDPDELTTRQSGLTIVPADGGRVSQLVQLTPEGLSRWRIGAVGEATLERVTRRWARTEWAAVPSPSVVEAGGAAEPGREIGAGVTPPVDVPAPPDGTAPGRDGENSADERLEALIERIVQVCEARHENPRVRRVGEPPYLRVTVNEDGVIREERIAALTRTPTREDIDAFLALVLADAPELGGELVYQGPPVARSLRDDARRRGLRVRSFTEFQGLLDLRNYVEGQARRLAEDSRYPAGLYVTQRFRNLIGSDQAVRTDLVGELIRLLSADDGRFVLLLGDFGRGKTFALRELVRRIPAELPHLIPILIELRALDKAHSIDGLVASHLANQGEEVIDLKAFRYMLRQGRIVLLFDGFDELATRVSYDRAADHLETLLQAAEDKAKIVVASRTQHFKTQAQVLTAMGERVGLLPQRRVLGLEEFNSSQIKSYLVNRYDGDEGRALEQMRRISRIEDLLGLAGNPRMLTFVADLEPQRLETVASARRAISGAALYQEILTAWLAFEVSRVQDIPGVPVALDLDQLWEAVTALAVRLWESGEQYLRLAEVTEIARALTDLTDAPLSGLQRAHAVGAGSLLIRTDDGLFGFIHSSVVEWLVAKEVSGQLGRGAAGLLSRRPLSALTVEFLCDMGSRAALEAWVDKAMSDPDIDDVSRQNAMKIGGRIRVPAHADLRGASLKGEDLSARELPEVDLSDADLTDARLVRTNLSGATLRNARLVDVRLDQAHLRGADLRGADLSGARLLRTDLRGVRTEGSSWRRAVLVDVLVDPGFFAAPELRGAAHLADRGVDVELAPPSVGVAYGFEVGRIPDPVAFSKDGGTLAVGSDEGDVVLCDGATGLPVRTLRRHHGRAYRVTFADTGDLLASVGSDGRVVVTDGLTGEEVTVLGGHHRWAWPVVFAPDGATIATGDASGLIRIWDTATGKVLSLHPGHGERIWTAAFRPDGSLLAVGDDSNTLQVWDTRTGKRLLATSAAGGGIYRLAFDPSGRILATAHHEGGVRLWNPETGELLHELTEHTGRVYTLDFDPAGAHLITGDTDGAVHLWDPATGTRIRTLHGHRGAVYRVRYSPDGQQVATGDSDGVVRLWDAGTGRLQHTLTSHRASVWPMVFRPTGGSLVTSSNDGTTRVWDRTTGGCRYVLRGHGRKVTSVAFDRTGKTLAACGNDGTVGVWDVQTGQRSRVLASPADRFLTAIFNPADEQLAAVAGDGSVRLWDPALGVEERHLNVGTEHVWAVLYSPDGDVMATASDDDDVSLWYRTTGRNIGTFADHRGRVRTLAFDRSGRTLATGCDDSKVRLWDTGSGACRMTLAGHTNRVYSVGFDAEGSTLFSAGHDGAARVWDTASGALLHTMTGHTGRLWSAALTPDGRILATAGDDRVIRGWDTRSGELRWELTGHQRRIASIAFSPDGRSLASGSDDGTIRLWDVEPGTGSRPTLRSTLIGLPEGWATLLPDGRYKLEGVTGGEFWHVVGLARFDPGELEEYVPKVRRQAVESALPSRPEVP